MMITVHSKLVLLLHFCLFGAPSSYRRDAFRGRGIGVGYVTALAPVGGFDE
jgi:hypothetical protein